MNKKDVIHLLIFLGINFAGLGIRGFITKSGVASDWYQNLSKAPWTPPGWVFGVAWSLIKLCFAFYMTFLLKAYLQKNLSYKPIIILFAIQWVLNLAWNPLFFSFHYTLIGLVVISALSIVVGYFLFNFNSLLKAKTMFIVPYFIWMIIATSLNGYVVFFN